MVHWKGGVTSWGGYTKLGEIRPSNSLQDYEVPGGGVLCKEGLWRRERGGEGGRGVMQP